MNDTQILNELKEIYLLYSLKRIVNSFEGHKGRPGKVGGSLPRGETSQDSIKPNSKEAIEESKQQANKLNEKEKETIRIYTDDNAYKWINGYLRKGGWLDKEDKKVINSLNKILKKASLPEDMTLYRSVGSNFTQEITNDYKIANLIREPISEENLEKIKAAFINKINTDDGFVSTSYEHAAFSASSPLVMIIKAPKGLNALVVDELSKFDQEKEIIINKGYKYKIYDVKIGTSPIGEKQYQLFTEIIV